MQENFETEIFGQNVKIVDGFFSAKGSSESHKYITPRKKQLRRIGPMEQILEHIAGLFNQGHTGSEIARSLDIDTDTVTNYKKIIVDFNGIDEAGIQSQKEKQMEFRNEDNEKLLKRPEVKDWFDHMKADHHDGKAFAQKYLANLGRICRAVEMSPISLCQKDIYAVDRQKALREINKILEPVAEENTEAAFYPLRMTMRNWLGFNGISLGARGQAPKNLRGNIVNHGASAHVRATEAEIDQVDEILAKGTGMPYPELAQDTRIFFLFGVETASREMTIFSTQLIKGATVQHNSQKLVSKILVNERKLAHVGKNKQWKRVFCKKLQDLIQARINAGEKLLVGKPNQFFDYAGVNSDKASSLGKKGEETKKIADNLRFAYAATGLDDPYFTKKPNHSLRHIAAQYWLAKSNYDYGFVAELGNWTVLDELKTSYGAMSDEIFDQKYGTYTA